MLRAPAFNHETNFDQNLAHWGDDWSSRHINDNCFSFHQWREIEGLHYFSSNSSYSITLLQNAKWGKEEDVHVTAYDEIGADRNFFWLSGSPQLWYIASWKPFTTFQDTCSFNNLCHVYVIVCASISQRWNTELFFTQWRHQTSSYHARIRHIHSPHPWYFHMWCSSVERGGKRFQDSGQPYVDVYI